MEICCNAVYLNSQENMSCNTVYLKLRNMSPWSCMPKCFLVNKTREMKFSHLPISSYHFNMMTPTSVTSGSHENIFQYRESHQWVTGLYCLYGVWVFKEWNNLFLTWQLEQRRCVGFVRATEVSNGSYSKGSEFFFTSVVWGSPMAHGMKFKPGKSHLGANVLRGTVIIILLKFKNVLRPWQTWFSKTKTPIVSRINRYDTKDDAVTTKYAWHYNPNVNVCIKCRHFKTYKGGLLLSWQNINYNCLKKECVQENIWIKERWS